MVQIESVIDDDDDDSCKTFRGHPFTENEDQCATLGEDPFEEKKHEMTSTTLDVLCVLNVTGVSSSDTDGDAKFSYNPEHDHARTDEQI